MQRAIGREHLFSERGDSCPMTAQKATEEVAATVVVDVVERRPRSVCSGAKYFYLGIIVLRRKEEPLECYIMEETVGRRRKRHFLLLYSSSPPRPLFLPISSPELYCIHLSPTSTSKLDLQLPTPVSCPPPPQPPPPNRHPGEKKSGCGDGAHIVRLRGGERERPDVK